MPVVYQDNKIKVSVVRLAVYKRFFRILKQQQKRRISAELCEVDGMVRVKVSRLIK